MCSKGTAHSAPSVYDSTVCEVLNEFFIADSVSTEQYNDVWCV